MIDIFQHSTYRSFVVAALGGAGRRSGARSRAAEAMGCQLPYLSRVLRGDADLSLEQGYALADFLKLGVDERAMLLLLIQKDRSGRADLRRHFEAQIEALLDRRRKLENRLSDIEELGPEDAAIYYGSWVYACLHMMVAIPELRTREALIEKLALPAQEIVEALEFLISRRLIAVDQKGLLIPGPNHLHLKRTSPNIRKHHANWRLKALQSLDRGSRPAETHYAAVFTLSRKDAMAIQERTLRYLEENLKTVQDSAEEAVYVSVVDWFEIP